VEEIFGKTLNKAHYTNTQKLKLRSHGLSLTKSVIPKQKHCLWRGALARYQPAVLTSFGQHAQQRQQMSLTLFTTGIG
jgi:hypothetical protein